MCGIQSASATPAPVPPSSGSPTSNVGSATGAPPASGSSGGGAPAPGSGSNAPTDAVAGTSGGGPTGTPAQGAAELTGLIDQLKALIEKLQALLSTSGGGPTQKPGDDPTQKPPGGPVQQGPSGCGMAEMGGPSAKMATQAAGAPSYDPTDRRRWRG